MKNEQIDEIIQALSQELKERRKAGGLWRGELSSSAISTSVALFALHTADKNRFAKLIDRSSDWLIQTMKPEGSWGDTMESQSNLTATLLSYASLYAIGKAPQQTKSYLTEKFGGYTDKHIIEGVLAYYGTDLTFSAPILVMCALAGVIADWSRIPQLPFELSVVPQRFFRFLNLPVVSYAIPALIAVGILRYRKTDKNIFSPLRESFIAPSLKVLERLQPANGGFLEAPPLTAFVTMCMTAAGYREHITTKRCLDFLSTTVRADGSWPIDSDLAHWVTSLSVKALGSDLAGEEKELLTSLVKKGAFKEQHHFTGAIAGGWGWTDLPGAAPDADDTSGALVALHTLVDGKYCEEAGKGVMWLLALQNSDGGMPTFCKGWGKLPFDRSSPDISAHALLAYSLWMDVLPDALKRRCRASAHRLLKWMEQTQASNGSWTPLWFGDQDATDERAPVYATAVALESLVAVEGKGIQSMIEKGSAFLVDAQNSDGGWGGAKGVESKVTMTARAVSALAASKFIDSSSEKAVNQGVAFLIKCYHAGELLRPEPIGLYFARLWYSEEMYNLTFTLNALKKYKQLAYKS